mmetsp:Transcript_45806/g.133372  ORF Transcript_45806/g.133372 Transcript_45806/m.133372 type:complete len:338 (-) Transcript_45806:396-1409(-)
MHRRDRGEAMVYGLGVQAARNVAPESGVRREVHGRCNLPTCEGLALQRLRVLKALFLQVGHLGEEAEQVGRDRVDGHLDANSLDGPVLPPTREIESKQRQDLHNHLPLELRAMRLDGLHPVIHAVAVHRVHLAEEHAIRDDKSEVGDRRRQDKQQAQHVQHEVNGIFSRLEDDDRLEVKQVHIIFLIRVDVVGHDVLDVPTCDIDAVGEGRMGQHAIESRIGHESVVRRVVHNIACQVPREHADERNAPHRIVKQDRVDHGPHCDPCNEAQGNVRRSHLVCVFALTFEVLAHDALQVFVEGVVKYHCGLIDLCFALLLDFVARQRLQQHLAVGEHMV